MDIDRNLKTADRLAARLTGCIDNKEEEALQQWLQEDARNRELYEKLVASGHLSEKLEDFRMTDLEQMKDAFLRKAEQKRRHHLYFRRISRIAAILMLPLAIGCIYLWSVMMPDNDGPLAHDILPGKEFAILQMSDGQRVSLTSMDSALRLEIHGMEVINERNSLSYRIKNNSRLVGEEYNTIIVPRGAEYQIQLSDGTHIWLNSESSLYYPTRFIKDVREVWLTGEAYFDVASDGKVFKVHGGGQCISVKGTTFNVKAYKDEKTVQTALETGCIEISLDSFPDRSVVLQPGQVAEADPLKGLLGKRRSDIRNHIGWKDKLFIFDDEDLETIMRKLTRWYNVNVHFCSEELKTKKFYAVIPRYETISTILDMLKKSRQLDYRIEGRNVHLYGVDTKPVTLPI